MMLTACGGGGDSDGNSTTNAAPDSQPSNPAAVEPITSAPVTSDPSAPNDGQTNNPPPDNNVRPDNNEQAALTASNEISIARTSCGLGGTTADTALQTIAVYHANYIKYVFANSTPTSFNAHVENKINDIANVTGDNNPFFRGESFKSRLLNANYANANNGVTENIAQSVYFNSVGDIVAPNVAASDMAKSLLAAPYHLRSLMLPSSTLIGTGFVAYKPFDRNTSQYQGYVLVTHAAATSETRNNTVAGIFTYPCQNVTDTVTALYNETPNPVAGSGRDLQTDPIGQPIYISMPSAKSIKVSNIKFRDVQRNIDVPTQLLDVDNDPQANTIYQLPVNEAFILPITDTLKSCESGRKKDGNCGLYGNSEYRVSFDVLVNNQTLTSKAFTFKTGEVSY